MAAKPASEPRWANVGGAITVPTSGKQDIGFIVEKPGHQHFNWLFNLIWQWVRYLSDQAFVGALSTTGAFSAASAVLSGALTAASALVSGTVTAASVACATLMTAGQVQTGEADIRHGDRTLVLPACSAALAANFAYNAGGPNDQITATASTAAFAYFPVRLAVGDRIKSFRLLCDTPAAAADIVVTMYKHAPGVGNVSAAAAVSLGTASSTATSNVQPVAATLGAPHTMAADESVQVLVAAANTTGSKAVFALQVTFDRP